MLKTLFTTLKAFVAGVLAILVFHQGGLAGLHYLGQTPVTAYSMTPAWPLETPVLWSWLLWGGVWGILLWGLVRRAQAAGYYVSAILLGAILPSAAYLFVVMPLAGAAPAAGWDSHFIAGVLLLNALWGLGVAVIMRMFKPPI